MERVRSGRRTPGSGSDSTVSGFRQGAVGIAAAEIGHKPPGRSGTAAFLFGSGASPRRFAANGGSDQSTGDIPAGYTAGFEPAIVGPNTRGDLNPIHFRRFT